MPTLTINCTSDGNENSTSNVMTTGASEIVFGKDGGNSYHSMLKFPLPSTGWLLNKVLTEVSLRYVSASSPGTGSFQQTLYLEKAASPANIGSGGGNISGRTKTTADVRWYATDLGTWSGDTPYTFTQAATGETLLSLVDALLDTEGPAAGFTRSTIDALNFITIYGTGSGSRKFVSSEASATNMAQLTLTYAEPGKIWDGDVQVMRIDSKTIKVS